MKQKRYKREQRSYIFETSIEVERVYRGNGGGRGKKRHKRQKVTEEQIEKQNQYNREKKLRRIIKENFTEDDYWVLLTYLKGYRTSIKDAKKDFRKFTRILRREYRKRGYELKWIVRTEVGKRGAAHHHFLVNRIPDGDLLIKNVWKKIDGAGFPSFKLTYEDGGFKALAWYLTKPPDEKDDEEGKTERNYSRSRNLVMPEPVIERANAKEMRVYPKPLPGYFIDPDSVSMGINPLTGQEYQYFIMYKLGCGEIAPVQQFDPGGGG